MNFGIGRAEQWTIISYHIISLSYRRSPRAKQHQNHLISIIFRFTQRTSALEIYNSRTTRMVPHARLTCRIQGVCADRNVHDAETYGICFFCRFSAVSFFCRFGPIGVYWPGNHPREARRQTKQTQKNRLEGKTNSQLTHIMHCTALHCTNLLQRPPTKQLTQNAE